MNPGDFPKFSSELREHAAPGYHVVSGSINIAVATDWFAKQAIHCPESFLKFLAAIGAGRFFGGDLIIFSLGHGKGTIEDATAQLPEAERNKYFAIGYDGTTEGCYCLDRSGDKASVFWHNFEAGETVILHPNFMEWIEESPAQLFNEQVYTGYRKVRDMAGVRQVIRECAAFEVHILSANATKIRPPGHEKDFLPRYHHLVLGIRKLQESRLSKLTVSVVRTGSSIGSDNLTYLTIDLRDFPVGTEVAQDVFVFDPFNLPFKRIAVIHVPEIDLSTPMRTMFKEIKDFL